MKTCGEGRDKRGSEREKLQGEMEGVWAPRAYVMWTNTEFTIGKGQQRVSLGKQGGFGQPPARLKSTF